MKKNILFCLMTSIAILAVSCTKEQGTDVHLGKVEFNATISQDAAPESKVEIGTFEEGKAKLFFQKGDKIKLVYASGAYDAQVTSVTETGIATIVAESAPVDGVIMEAWYPGDSYSNGEMSAPSIQQHGNLPIILKGSLQGEELLFSADPGFTFISYPLTGTLQIKEAYLYFRDTPNLFSAYGEVCPSDYTLKFDTPLQLTEEAQNIHFVIPASAGKVVTLEVKTPTPEGALISDYKLLRRKKTAVDFSNGKAKVMPVMNFSETDTDISGSRWAGETLLNTAVDQRIGKGENTYTLEGNVVKCNLYATGNYQKLNMYIKSNPHVQGKIYPGNHRYVAIKSNIVHAMSTPPEGHKAAATPDWDFRLSNAESTATQSFQFLEGKTRYRKSGEIDCGDNVKITYFDLLQNWNNYYFPTNLPVGTKGCYFVQQITYKDADGNITHPDLTVDVYWFGFFNSLEEIQAYEASLNK